MDSAIIIASFAFITAATTPLIQSYIRRQDKKADYLRQDEVAERAKTDNAKLLESQEKLASQNNETARLLVQSNEKSDHRSDVQDAKLDQIHTLVNSNLTAEMQARLVTLRSFLDVSLKYALHPPTMGEAELAELASSIADTRSEIAKLAAQLEDRLQQTQVASEQLQVDLGKDRTKS